MAIRILPVCHLRSPRFVVACYFEELEDDDGSEQESVKGSLNIDTMCQEGAFLVDNISFYPEAKLGTELTAEADWKRRGLYIGPQFDSLDLAVQEEFEKWMNERGVNESLATFIPEYSEYKEQKVCTVDGMH